MLNKQQVFKLICNRMWIYQSILNNDPNPMLLILNGNEEDSSKSFFSIYFHKNGRVSAATKVGFFPNEFATWDFDKATQEIIFINRVNQSEIRASLPQRLPYGGLDSIKLKNESANQNKHIQFVNDPQFDCQEISSRTLGGEKVFITPRATFDIFLRYKMRWIGFNIKLVDYTSPSVEFFSEIYEYLAARPHIKHIVISQKNKVIIKFSKSQKLLLLSNQNKPSFEYLSGDRSTIMELLLIILSENNLRLFDDNDHRDETTMLQDILTNHFQERYELDNLPGF